MTPAATRKDSTKEQMLEWLYTAIAMRRREDGLRVIVDEQWNYDMRSAIRALILAAPAPKRVSREWVEQRAKILSIASLGTVTTGDVLALLRELGVEVEDSITPQNGPNAPNVGQSKSDEFEIGRALGRKDVLEKLGDEKAEEMGLITPIDLSKYRKSDAVSRGKDDILGKEEK